MGWGLKGELSNQLKLEFRILKKYLNRFSLRNWFQWAGSFISEWFTQSMGIRMIKAKEIWQKKKTGVLKIFSDQLWAYSPLPFSYPTWVSCIIFFFQFD